MLSTLRSLLFLNNQVPTLALQGFEDAELLFLKHIVLILASVFIASLGTTVSLLFIAHPLSTNQCPLTFRSMI